MRRACLAAGLLLLSVAVYLAATSSGSGHRSHAVALVNLGQLSPTGSTNSAPHEPERAGQGVPLRGAPVPTGARLHLTRLGVNAPITHVAAVAGVMQVPREPRMVGWWTAGARPGDPHGTVVIVGHINYAGVSGALAVLPNVRIGDSVSLSAADGYHHAYRVFAVRSYPKTSGIPATVFTTTGPARLVLITCGGPFDPATGNYEDNIVAYANAA